MKNLKRKPNIWTGNNVQLDTDTMQATSYAWWHFVKKFNGKIVFNRYNYSRTTVKHQHKVARIMRDLGIKIDLVVHVAESLNSSKFYNMTLKQLEAESNNQLKFKEEQNKAKAKSRRVMKKIEELGLYLDNRLVVGHLARNEADKLCGVQK